MLMKIISSLHSTIVCKIQIKHKVTANFKGVSALDCENLRVLVTIHINAFNTTDSVMTEIFIRSNPLLTSPDNLIFQVLSKFVRASH